MQDEPSPDVLKEVTAPDNLPTAINLELPLLPINELSSLNQVKRADMEIAATVLEALSIGWVRARTVEDICKLSLTTMKTLEYRRKLLCMQYGDKAQTVAYGSFVEPID